MFAIQTVSYTHLDVYKRQMYNEGIIREEVCIVTKQKNRLKQFILILLSFLMIFSNAVSYTHLVQAVYEKYGVPVYSIVNMEDIIQGIRDEVIPGKEMCIRDRFGFTEEPLSQPAAASSAQGTPFG